MTKRIEKIGRGHRRAGVLFFDGVSGYVTVPDNAALALGAGDFTICFWIKGSSGGFIVKKINVTEGYEIYWDVDVYLHIKRVEVPPLNVTLATTDFSVLTTTFSHICFSVKRNEYIKIYVNGVLNTSSSLVESIPYDLNTTNNFVISPITEEFTFSGSLDDLRVYKEALNAGQVKAIWNGGHGCRYSPNQAGHASFAMGFDELRGRVVKDAVQGLRGTLVGGVNFERGGV